MLSFRDIAKIFEEIELRLIASLKRNLSRHKAEEEKEGFEWSAWQAEKLNNIDNFRKENAQIADEYVDVIDDETRQLMTDQFHEGEHTAEQSVIDVSESGVNVPDVPNVPAVPTQPQPPEAPTAIPDDHFFGVNKPKMDKLMEDVTTLEKTALTAAVRNMDDVYRTTLNKVQLMMGTGSITLNEAIDLATRDFLDKGINCIVYADGRRVNIADYVRMALRTTSTRATLQGAAKRFAELGYDTVLISQYGGCSETCEPYQGKVYKRRLRQVKLLRQVVYAVVCGYPRRIVPPELPSHYGTVHRWAYKDTSADSCREDTGTASTRRKATYYGA